MTLVHEVTGTDIGSSQRSIPSRLVTLLTDASNVLQQLRGLSETLQASSDPFRKSAKNEFHDAESSIWLAETNLTATISHLQNAVALVSHSAPFGIDQDDHQRSRDFARSTHCVHSCEGLVLTSCLVEAAASTTKVELVPDVKLAELHPDVRLSVADVFDSAMPGRGQALLLPLLTTDQCSVAVERGPSAAGPAPSSGFTVAALLGLASKLLWAFERKVAAKGVFVTRQAKAQQLTDLLDLMPRSVHCVNLATGQRPDPVSNAHPRIIVCTAQDIVEHQLINTEDTDHLIIDDCNDATERIFNIGAYRRLRDVVVRGPPAAITRLPTPQATKFRARSWTVDRTVNIFDVQLFNMEKQIEELFASLPIGRNYLLTVQPNVTIQNVVVVSSLAALPEDVDHLVIAELPATSEEIAGCLRLAAARVVTLLVTPMLPKVLIVQAMEVEGIRQRPNGLAGAVTSTSLSAPAVRY